jgi:phage terminase small subunit
MARPKKPHALKVISGSRRVERDRPAGVYVEPLDAPPPPPEWLLDPAALAEWRRLAVLLTANRMLTMLDLAALAHLCAVHGQIVTAHLAGLHPKASLVTVYQQLAGAFGLTPATRGRGTAHELDRRPNPFDQFRR